MADLVNTTNVSMLSGISNNNNNNNNSPKNYYISKDTKRKYSYGFRYKTLQFFENIQPFLVGILCLGMVILLPIVISNHFEENKLQGKIKAAYDRLQSRLKAVENQARIPGPKGSTGSKGDLGLPGRNGLTGPKGKDP